MRQPEAGGAFAYESLPPPPAAPAGSGAPMVYAPYPPPPQAQSSSVWEGAAAGQNVRVASPAAAAAPPADGAPAEGRTSSSEIPVGSVLGIPVRVHILLPAITLLYTLYAWLNTHSTTAAVFMFLLTGPVLYGSVFLHELGHCLAARRVGGVVDGILLWPLGGLAYIGHSGDAKDDLLIAAAGPLTHGPQAAAWGILYAIAKAAQSYNWTWLCLGALRMQLSLLVFNLLSPAYPLDGGRIAVDLLSMRGVALDTAARITAGLSLATGSGIVIYALAAPSLPTLPVGVWVLVQAWELLGKVRRGEARQHPMFINYQERVQGGAGGQMV